jgi:hypothetical protein
MRLLIVKILLRLLGREYYQPLSKESVDRLLFQLANEEGLERLPDFLQQCADQQRNQYLYTKDERFRGSVLAFITLRERIIQKKTTVKSEEKKKKILTKDKKSVKIEKVVY